MDGFKRLMSFGVGGAIGTAIGMVVGSLMAPQSGKDLQKTTGAFVDEVKRAGDIAQASTEAQLKARFQERVNDPTALSDLPSTVVIATTATTF